VEQHQGTHGLLPDQRDDQSRFEPGGQQPLLIGKRGIRREIAIEMGSRLTRLPTARSSSLTRRRHQRGASPRRVLPPGELEQAARAS
jgi:hypothetical protein